MDYGLCRVILFFFSFFVIPSVIMPLMFTKLIRMTDGIIWHQSGLSQLCPTATCSCPLWLTETVVERRSMGSDY